GYILTSTYNLITRPPVITVVRQDGGRHVAKLVARDDARKICLLKVAGVRNWPVPKYVSDAELRVGQWAITVGLGFGKDPVISAGIISAKDRIGGRAVQTDANISPANYGGPLLTIDGRVIGVCVPLNPRSKNDAGGVEWYDSGIGFAIPLADAGPVIAAMKSGKNPQPAALGVRVKEADAKSAGLAITQIVKSSAAEKSGLKVGDRILAVGKRKTATATRLRFALARFIAGQKTVVRVQRGGRTLTLAVVLGVGRAAPAARRKKKPETKKAAAVGADARKRPGDRVPHYTIHRATGKITIDGKLGEADWKAAKSVGPFRFAWWKAGKKEQTEAKLLWDDEHLYVSFHCRDAHVTAEHTKRDSPVYRDDCVEVFIAPNPKHPDNYFNIEMNVKGAFLDQHHPDGPGVKRKQQWNATGVKIGVTVDGTLNDDSDTDRGWVLEVAVPFKNYGKVAANTPPKAGDVWRLNLNRLGGQTNPQYSQWSSSRTKKPAFHVPRDFGRVTFSAKRVR
ncbi:MAG: carbohydrate-binding family 9-like protein, partial [Planctomycetaceae bacterium]